MNQHFLFADIKGNIKSIFTGVKEEDIIISSFSETQLQEIFVIEKYSGILKGNLFAVNTIDKDILSGMLAAIKSGVENIFKTDIDQLEIIEYGMYKIHIHNFETCYIAVVLYGTFDTIDREDLEKNLLLFSEKNYTVLSTKDKICLT